MLQDFLRLDNSLILFIEQGTTIRRDVPSDSEYIYIALVESGTCTYTIEGAEYVVSAGDILVIIQNQSPVLQQRSEDFCAWTALLSREYVNQLHVPHTYMMFLSLRRDPVLHLSENSWKQLDSCFNLISTTLQHTNNAYKKQTIYYALKTYLFTIAFLAQARNKEPLTHEQELTREQDLTMRFMDLLEENYRTQHSVTFYAEQMHLSVKYVSAIVKSSTGKTAMKCIADRLLEQAEKMLRQPFTISEVCYELGFQSPSAFGKFFRTKTGIGPREWRKQNGNMVAVE